MFFGEDHIEYPYKTYESLKNKEPIIWMPELGAWFVHRHKNVLELFSHNKLSSKRDKLSHFNELQRSTLSELINFYSNWLMFNDPPIHNSLRTTAISFVKERSKSINSQEIISSVLNPIAQNQSGQTVNVLKSVVEPISVSTFAQLFRWDISFTRTILQKSEIIVFLLGQSKPPLDLAINAQNNLREIVALIKESVNLTISLDGMDAKVNDITHVLLNILIDGHKSICSATANTAWFWGKYRSGFALNANIEEVVEEIIRREPIFQYVSRIALEPFDYVGVKINTGDKIVLSIGASNYDLKTGVNACPRHLTFGHGRHYCIGALLARTILRDLLQAFNEQFEDLKIISADWEKSIGYRSLSSFEAEFSAIHSSH